MGDHADLIILGSGSTAFAAAIHAVSFGARVLMFEKSVMGGTCINWGCIPSKTLIHAALFNHEARLGAGIGLNTGTAPGEVDAGRLFKHRDGVVEKLRRERYLEVLAGLHGLELVKGTARCVGRRTVECEGQVYRSDRILIATGGIPRVPRLPGLDQCDWLTSRSALLQKQLPASLVIIGGGVIAVELGQMYVRLGCRVTIIEHGPRLLPAVEPELSAVVEKVLVREQITVVTGATVCALERRGGTNAVIVEVSGDRHTFCCEKLLLAVGTEPASNDLGLEHAGVERDAKGFIITDSSMRTTAEGVWAAGDVVGRTMIATVGAREGIVAVDDMFNPGCGCRMDYLAAPMAIFTDPEVAMVGHTEVSAHTAGFEVAVNTIPAGAIPKAHVTGATDGVIKMIADKVTGRLLGVHLACHRGAEMINEAALALHLRATVTDLATTMHVYPSIGEGLKLCAQGFDRDISKLSCCAE